MAELLASPQSACGISPVRVMATPLSVRSRSWSWRARALIFLISAFFAAPLVLEAHRVIVGTNFHTVLPGRVYRSAQLDEKDLRRYVAQHGIRTVVNLRGECPQFGWYQTERTTLAELGVIHRDINFSSTLVPAVSEFRELVETLTTCEYPLLIHCRRGADRTGLASAICLLLASDADPENSRSQMDWRYGHFEAGRSGRLHLVLDMYKAWLAAEGKVHQPELFQYWVLHEYQPGPFWARIEPLDVPAQLPHGKPVAARFRVHNLSRFPWQFKQGANCGMHLRFLLTNRDEEVRLTGGAGYFEHTLQPGESIELTLSLPAVRKPGTYDLKVDMADEQQCWFFMVGSTPYETELTVPRE